MRSLILLQLPKTTQEGIIKYRGNRYHEGGNYYNKVVTTITDEVTTIRTLSENHLPSVQRYCGA